MASDLGWLLKQVDLYYQEEEQREDKEFLHKLKKNVKK